MEPPMPGPWPARGVDDQHRAIVVFEGLAHEPFGQVAAIAGRAAVLCIAAALSVGTPVRPGATLIDDLNQLVIDRRIQVAAVQDGLVLEDQNRRLALGAMLEIVVAALAEDVPIQDRTLGRIDTIFDGIVQPIGTCLMGLRRH